MRQSRAPTSLHPDDLPRAVAVCRAASAPALDADWSVNAGDFEWDCRRTLHHIADSLAFSAIHLATRATTRKMPSRNGAPTRRPGEPSDVPDLFDMAEGMAAVLADVARRRRPEPAPSIRPAWPTPQASSRWAAKKS